MSRRKKRNVQRKKPRTESQNQRDVVVDTAARFACSRTIAADFAAECDRRSDDLEIELDFNRIALHFWRDRPGQGPALIELFTALAAERERHLAVLDDLARRFAEIADQDVHEHLEPIEPYRDHIRQQIFPDLPPF